LKEEAQAVAAKLEGLKISIGAKTSTTGKIFGSVNNIQIAEALKENGFDIDRKQITIKQDAIKEVGKHVAKIKLHREVYFELEFEVVSE
jgi:large subunit ribosomal protein L9